MPTAIAVNNLKKSFNETEIFQDFSLDIEHGKITAIFGPNGAGKTTLLNILSGLTIKDSGSHSIENFSPFNFSYIFQNYRESLLPWNTNYDNVALPLQIQGKTKLEIKNKIEELEKLLGLKMNWKSYPYEQSGGQQQIVAFMRALITSPKILFIDEPFSALDYENNLILREHLQKYYLKFLPTIVLITHNIEEATHLAHKIVVLTKKPTRVLEMIDNPLIYPRTVESLKTPEFHRIKDQVLSAFQKAANL